MVLWDTFQRGDYGKSVLGYALWNPQGEKVFEGEDFSPGAGMADDSDEVVRGLLGFLSLRPGDTDAEYFEGYTDRQRAWAESSACEELSLWADEEEDYTFVDDPAP